MLALYVYRLHFSASGLSTFRISLIMLKIVVYVAVILQAEFALDVYVAVNGYTRCRFITGCCSFLQAVMIIA